MTVIRSPHSAATRSVQTYVDSPIELVSHPFPGGIRSGSVEPSNATLLARVSQDDRRAWGKLVERYAQAVWAATASFDLDHDSRLDISQTVWLRLYDRSETIRHPERLVGWLCQVARNEAISVIRRRTRLFSLENNYDADLSTPPADDGLGDDEDAAVVAHALAGLDTPCRELLTLCLSDPPLSYDEIASILGMARGSIGPTRQRCLQKLKRDPGIARLLLSGGN